MRLSRLSNRQLLRLIKNGEVRFAVDQSQIVRKCKIEVSQLNTKLKEIEKSVGSIMTMVANDLDDSGNASLKRKKQEILKTLGKIRGQAGLLQDGAIPYLIPAISDFD